MKHLYTLVILLTLIACGEKEEINPTSNNDSNSNYFVELELFFEQSMKEDFSIDFVNEIDPYSESGLKVKDTLVYSDNLSFYIHEPFDRTLDSIKVYNFKTDEPFYLHKK